MLMTGTVMAIIQRMGTISFLCRRENVMARSLGFVSICFVGLVALALCVPAWAQPAPGAKPPPAARTFRPLGTMSTSVLAMLYSNLLPMPTVQKELNLSEDQQTKVKEATDKSHAAMREFFAGIRDLSPEDRQAKIEETRKKMQAQAEETRKTIEGILLPKQLERLKGLALQMAGVSAIVDKEVQHDLKLSDDQVAKIKTASEDLRKKAGELMSEGADPMTLRPKMQQLRIDYEKQVMDVLTAEQKASLEKMKGAKFDFGPVYSLTPPPAKAPAETKGKP
jgi:hypothetical protein